MRAASRKQIAAQRLNLKNTRFRVGDARDLEIDEEYDAIMMVDLLHHIDDGQKRRCSTSARRTSHPMDALLSRT
ncbi:MAG: class I SAM-dependent methyltransferase [Pyrinomonadaceae bacterium]